MLKVIYMDVADTEPRIMQIERENIEILQELLGGSFDILYPDNYGITSTIAQYDIYVNDSFMDGNWLPNVALNIDALLQKDYDRAGIVFGPLLVAGYDDEGAMTAVKDEDIEDIFLILKAAMLQNEKRGKAR